MDIPSPPPDSGGTLPPKAAEHKFRDGLIGFAVLVAIVAGCQAIFGDDTPGAPKSSTDGGAFLACAELGSFAHDVNAGVLLHSEYRARAQKVYDKGVLAHDPRIVLFSTELLRAFTTGTDADQGAAVTSLHTACVNMGL